MGLWIMLVFVCTDVNTCVTRKTYFPTQAECVFEAEREQRLIDQKGRLFTIICRSAT